MPVSDNSERKGIFLITFTDLIFGATFGAGFAFLWETSSRGDIWGTLLVLFTYLLMCDDWYGGRSLSLLYPYAQEMFFLDIFSMFDFVFMFIMAVVGSSWFVFFLALYGCHGALWDYIYARRVPKNTEAHEILVSWFWCAELYAFVTLFTVLGFGLLGIFTMNPTVVLLILGSWIVWRLYFDWRIKYKIKSKNHSRKRIDLSRVVLREIREEDFEEVAQMRHNLWNIHSQESIYINGEYLAELDAEQELHESTKDQKMKVLVAEADGEIVGYTLFMEKDAEDFFSFKKYLYWDELLVKKEFRGIGIGKKVLEYVKQYAKQKGYPIIMGRIYPFSIVMKNLFLKEGGRELYGMFLMPMDFKGRTKTNES